MDGLDLWTYELAELMNLWTYELARHRLVNINWSAINADQLINLSTSTYPACQLSAYQRVSHPDVSPCTHAHTYTQTHLWTCQTCQTYELPDGW
jgi:hypothetical protein